MSALGSRAARENQVAPRPHRRRRPRICRPAAGRRVRAQRASRTTGIDLDAAQSRRDQRRASRTSRTSRAATSPSCARPAGSTRRPISPSSRSSTRSTSACRRRCARPRTPTFPTSCRRSRRSPRHLRPGMLVILESTTYPGTTDEVVQPMLEASGLKAGKDFFLAFSPERVDPGNPTFQTHNVPKVVGGLTPDVHRAGERALRHGDRHRRAGELDARRRDGQAAREHVPGGEHRPGQRAGADVRPDEHQRLGSGRRGDAPSRSGSWRSTPDPGSAATASRSTRSTCRGRRSRAASIRGSSSWPDTSTASMPHYVVEKVAEALNSRRKALNGSSILIAGVAYKRDIDDMRESPALDVMGLLHGKGARIVVHRSAHCPRSTARSWPGTLRPQQRPGRRGVVRAVRLHRDRHRPQGRSTMPRMVTRADVIVDTRNAIKFAAPNVFRLGAPQPEPQSDPVLASRPPHETSPSPAR